MKIGIIGAGVSGITSAILLKRKGYDVTVFEKNNTPLKKLSITGSGKCNYYNADITSSHYQSLYNNIGEFINKDNSIKALNFFESLGIISKNKDGYLYPFSRSALSFKNILLTECRILELKICLEETVINIEKTKKFIIETTKNIYEFDKIIISSGSIASVKENKLNFLEKFINKNNIDYVKMVPALVPLISDETHLKDWDGIRAEVNLSHYENDCLIRNEYGEIQCTSYGISGICAMNLSGLISRGILMGKQENIKINFIPFINPENGYEFIDNRNKTYPSRNIVELLETILNYKIILFLLKKSKLDKDACWDNLNEKSKERLVSNIFEFKLNIIDTKGFNFAQVANGGISLDEITKTFELKKVKGCYVTGETLDIVGDCGGFNLGFAFISGIVVGDSV